MFVPSMVAGSAVPSYQRAICVNPRAGPGVFVGIRARYFPVVLAHPAKARETGAPAEHNAAGTSAFLGQFLAQLGPGSPPATM